MYTKDFMKKRKIIKNYIHILINQYAIFPVFHLCHVLPVSLLVVLVVVY